MLDLWMNRKSCLLKFHSTENGSQLSFDVICHEDDINDTISNLQHRIWAINWVFIGIKNANGKLQTKKNQQNRLPDGKIENVYTLFMTLPILYIEIHTKCRKQFAANDIKTTSHCISMKHTHAISGEKFLIAYNLCVHLIRSHRWLNERNLHFKPRKCLSSLLINN